MEGKKVDKGSNYTVLPNDFKAPDDTQEFDTWEVNGEKVAPGTEIKVDDNTVIKALWKKIQVNVTYDANGGSGTMEGKKVDKGSDYTVLPNGFKSPDDTQEFSHWEIDGKEVEANKAIKIDKDTKIKAIWKDIEYKVTFNGNTGTGSMPEKLVKKGNEYELPANRFTAPENKIFSHWKIGNEDKNPGDKITVNGDTEVIAIWKDIKVKVSYNSNGGSGTMDGAELTKGSTYKLSSNKFTAPANKEFAGWKIGEKEYAPDAEIIVNEDTTVKAIWKDKTPETPPVENYTVSFKTETGATGTMLDQTVAKGKYTLPNPTFTAEKGKEFAGWKVGEGTDLKTVGSEIDITGNVTLTAVWKGEVTETVKVSYDANGGSGTMEGKELTKGSTYKLLANGFTAPENKEFDTWEVNGEKLSPNSKITVDKDTVIKAIWKNKIPETPPVENYTVSFKTEAGATGTMLDQTVAKGKYTLPNPTFTAEKGKEFAGWRVGEGTDLKTVGSEIDITGNVTLTAVWKGDEPETPPATETFKVSYDANGGSGTMTGAELKKGSTYKLLANGFKAPDKKKFKGWKIGETEYAAGDEITVNENTTVTAIWEDITTDPSTPDSGTNPDQGGDKPNPGTRPGEGDNPDKPGTRPGEGDNPDKPGTRPGEGDNPENPDKPGENPRPRTKPNGGENISKPKPDDDKITKKPEDNKENSLNNRKVQVTRTKDVKENVQTGVESLGKIGGILSAAIAGLFASKKRKNNKFY
ncbi:hypothetical protein ANHYDRO_01724 [Anaerococcus hydrogenalis DSM 7454]|uniref:Repeat protein n=1 Tax=Anaerococcus hydrogenalis DSM 7454 TaxID=561177 RepID=B6WAK8_9FIRM|nr:InlB B-repeat-containing protein [Anaerococcus hydrogenalis]EEB35540.1 hypothetical protein ANHYDRO_01724 [Anaerococcus hydrogenalis DSM 7454]